MLSVSTKLSNLNMKCPALFNLLAIVYEARAGRLSFYYNDYKVSVASVTRLILAGRGLLFFALLLRAGNLGWWAQMLLQALPPTPQLLLPSLRSPLQSRG
jgi:hypothetical protein